ncbi:MAG TPA: 50S ribosomal protein L30 [Actinomycetota bacterium]|jgi:large subunit ribosomal protein L30|nr:50S ribosomal protein L30 [Actinomycetota bacterium]
MSRLKVTQVRSAVDRGARQRGTIRALGIKRMGDSVVHEDRPEIRGMIRAVRHLVVVEEVDGGGSGDEER